MSFKTDYKRATFFFLSLLDLGGYYFLHITDDLLVHYAANYLHNSLNKKINKDLLCIAGVHGHDRLIIESYSHTCVTLMRFHG